MTDKLEKFLTYCARDGAVTIEIDQKLEKCAMATPTNSPEEDHIRNERRRHYNFNLTLLNALLYMELRGLRYDKDSAKQRKKEIDDSINSLQYQLDKCSGRGLGTTDKVVLRALVRDTMCYKRDQSKVKADYEHCYDEHMRTLLGEAELTPNQLGRLSIDLGVCLNTKGTGLKDFFYKELKLPEQKNAVSGAISTDYESLLKLSKLSPHPSIRLAIDIGELRTRSQMLSIATDPDGRVRCGYNEVGSETGRITCYTSPTGSGYALQTIPDENELKPVGHPLHNGMRDLLLADEGCFLAKCDLKGADGWTVGANLAALGDSTMLDDLKFGLKPASVLCYASRHGPGSIIGKSREQLAELCKEVKKSDWDYFAYKQCIWGFCYLMGVRKAVTHVFNVSEGTVLVKESDMQMAKDMLFRRYNIHLWHRAMEQRLFRQPYPPKLTSPSGHTRMFFGRKSDIVGEALAHEPQSVTTYATNQAVYRCWTDPENRQIKVSETYKRIALRIEPMHQVHDEALFQFRIEDTAWATAKIKQWFSNPIRIAGVEVTIPFEGVYGTNWSMDKDAKKGMI